MISVRFNEIHCIWKFYNVLRVLFIYIIYAHNIIQGGCDYSLFLSRHLITFVVFTIFYEICMDHANWMFSVFAFCNFIGSTYCAILSCSVSAPSHRDRSAGSGRLFWLGLYKKSPTKRATYFHIGRAIFGTPWTTKQRIYLITEKVTQPLSREGGGGHFLKVQRKNNVLLFILCSYKTSNYGGREGGGKGLVQYTRQNVFSASLRVAVIT